MSTRELAKLIGKNGWIQLGALKVYVRIDDVRLVYGKTQYQIVPADTRSMGSQWVESVKIDDQETIKP